MSAFEEDSKEATPKDEIGSSGDNVENAENEPTGDGAPVENTDDDYGKSKRVFVGNLAWEVSWQDLKDLFNTTGHDVTRADVMHTPDGRSKGCGIVEFASADGAKQAVLTLNDTELLGRQIFVREDREEQRGGGGGASQSQNSAHHKQSQRTGSNHQFSQGEQAQGRRVYVGNLSWDVAWTELKDHMRAEGKFNVAYAEVICEKNGRSKGCGIVEYSTEEEAHQAIEELTHTELKGRMIFVREDREIPSNPSVTNKAGEHTKGSKDHHNNQNTSVYIWNLDYSTTWFQLKDHMRKAGNVDQATILTNQDGSSMGCGVVTYQQPQEASRAIRELQDSQLNERPMKIRENRVQAGGRGSGGRGNRSSGRFSGRGGRSGRGFRLDDVPAAEGTQLFVTNLPISATWQKLKDHFKQVGDVDRANVKIGHGKPKFGTVRFYKKEDAARAIDEFNGVEMEGSALEIRLDHKV